VVTPADAVQLLEQPAVHTLFPSDVIERARTLQAKIPGGIGAYSDSQGARILREMIAAAIERRDGHPCDPEDLYLTDGASPAVHYLMLMSLRTNRDAFMVPIPQYPLYSATLALYGGQLVPYLLDEAQGWGLNMAHLEEALRSARQQARPCLHVCHVSAPLGSVSACCCILLHEVLPVLRHTHICTSSVRLYKQFMVQQRMSVHMRLHMSQVSSASERAQQSCYASGPSQGVYRVLSTMIGHSNRNGRRFNTRNEMLARVCNPSGA
jgi:bifunctional pyridoxal-dependent enzyme with beta-cystathionase and maltose regulon repressor activities